MRFAFLAPAEVEYLEQVVYYESQQAGLGARFVGEVVAALQSVCEMSQRFPVVRPPALRRVGLRHFPFSIYFRERDGAIEVVAVAPHRKRPGYWHQRSSD